MISSIDIGGAELLVYNICKGLLERNFGFEVHLLTFFKGNTLQKEFEKIGVIVKSLGFSQKNSFFNIVNKIFLPFLYMIKVRPQFVHTHLLDTDRYGLIASFLAGVKKRFSTVHNIEQIEGTGFKLTRKITSLFATKIIFVSECTRQHYTSKNVYPFKKSIVIYNAPGFTIDSVISPRKPVNISKTINIVNVGRLNIQKGQLYLIRALTKMQQSAYKFQLNIYGGDYLSYGSILKDEVANLHLDNVTFHGVSRNIKETLESADILVASSLFEGFHMVIVEAMSMGVPVIATDIPPHREILSPIKNYAGFVPTENPDAIADAILFLINNPDYYTLLSENEIRRANDFSQEKLIQNYLSLYSN
ncbi:MAG: glycosyltransferase family 4 protein [Bacteroidales bacterium]|nr:glycosyltransferase family 4 protein [Bacteroidales bacterium]